jgi:hypothetical protein
MFFAIWQVLAWIIHRPIMPSPLQVLPIFTASVFGNLGIHFLASTARVLAAIGVAVVTAVPIGLGLGQVPKVNRIFAPLIAIVYPIPKIVFLPVIYVLMGITDISKIFLIATIIFFQILVVVRDEAANLHVCLFSGIIAGGADGAAGICRNRHRSSVYCRTIFDHLRFRILYRCRNLPGAEIPRDVCRNSGHESVGFGTLFYDLQYGTEGKSLSVGRTQLNGGIDRAHTFQACHSREGGNPETRPGYTPGCWRPGRAHYLPRLRR